MPVADLLSVLLIAVGLSADCFTVAIGGSISNKNISVVLVLRISVAFGLFQALMPIIGWLLGQTVTDIIAAYDHWIAFVLLAIIGGRMIWQSIRNNENNSKNLDISKLFPLLILSVATSIDALAVGLTFAFIEISIIPAIIVIGIVAFISTVLGLYLGKKIGYLIGKRAEALGGIILVAIGIRILLSHIL